MIKGLSGRKFCLVKGEYENGDTINLGKGTLLLNSDKTFVINIDSLKSQAINGKWDLCCKGSDYGNYVFRVDNLPEWRQADPNLFVLLKEKKVRLFFGSCPDHLAEAKAEKELYNGIALWGTTPFDVSNSTFNDFEKHLNSNEDDSLRGLLQADLIEFYSDTTNNKFRVDSIVLFKKKNYYVLYDFGNRQGKFEEMIDTIYRKKIKKIDKNLYLIDE